MMPGTSPSVTALSNGGYEVAFQANTGHLWTVGSDPHGDWGLGMMPGTSPSLAGLSGSGYEVAFQANTGNLWTVGSDPHGDWGLGMMARTSPCLTAAYGGGCGLGSDAIAPSVAPARLAVARLSSSVKISWSGSDVGSGVASYQLRYRVARPDGGFGSWRHPTAWQSFPASSNSVTAVGLNRGYDYCYSVRAVDKAGNDSQWSAAHCTARALDDRTLVAASSGWRRGSGSHWWNATVTSSKHRGARLTLRHVRLDRVGIVATRCASCGSVAVFVGTHRVGVISLRTASTHYRQLILLPQFSLRTGSVSVKVISTGQPVQIDGVAVSCT
jgi:hypothetical protein